MSHTKGPWKAVRYYENFDGSFDTYFSDDEELQEYLTRPYTKIVTEQNKAIVINHDPTHDLFAFKNPADAHLVAAAPDMLSALEICEANLKSLPDSIYIKAMKDAVNEAIKKARGVK